MKLEDLTGGSADYLESLTDKELLEFFKPYLIVTRPSEDSTRKTKISTPTKLKLSSEKQQKMNKLKERFPELFV
jgi:hypothetical protein